MFLRTICPGCIWAVSYGATVPSCPGLGCRLLTPASRSEQSGSVLETQTAETIGGPRLATQGGRGHVPPLAMLKQAPRLPQEEVNANPHSHSLTALRR